MRFICLFLSVSSLVVWVAGCGGGHTTAMVCTPGASVSCTGPAGCSGGQVCSADGTSYGACNCGGTDGGLGTDSGVVDGSMMTADAGADAGTDPNACDPLANTGCGAGEKCAWKVESLDPPPGTGLTTCVPDGTASVGDACSVAAPGDGGYDDCVGGSWCVGGVCAPICDTAAGTCTGGVCRAYSGRFTDRTGVGVCVPTCDPLAQDCADTTHGCFLSVSDGAASCSSPSFSTTGQQGDACMYTNGCARGFGCHLPNAPTSATGVLCAYYCDAGGGSGPSCTDASGPGTGFGCASLRTFLTGLPASIPSDIGICVPCADYPTTAGCT